jgi:hypothetical protein
MSETSATSLTNIDELLYRQVHPNWVRDGRVTSQAFRPTKKDTDRLSVSCSSRTNAEGAYALHTGAKGLQSVGTWGVTVGEYQDHQLRSYYDPITSPPEPVPDDAHCYVDYSTLPSKSAIEAVGALVARIATARGCLFPPAANGPG